MVMLLYRESNLVEISVFFLRSGIAKITILSFEVKETLHTDLFVPQRELSHYS